MIKSVFLRRVLSWIIDAPVYACPAMVLATVLDNFEITLLEYISFIIMGVLMPLTFVLRDVITKGRSFGKRMFELNILDKSTNESASIKQKIVRNLFFLIYFIDGIVLLITGESIGDKVANTVVVKN